MIVTIMLCFISALAGFLLACIIASARHDNGNTIHRSNYRDRHFEDVWSSKGWDSDNKE